MDKKKKIIAILACVTVIATIFCISSFADNSEYYGLTIPNGTNIVFKDTINNSNFSSVSLNFYSAGMSCSDINYNNGYLRYYSSTSVTVYSNGSWNDPRAKTITLQQDYVLSDEPLSNFFINNAVSGLPEPPPPPEPLPEAISNVQETFTFTLTAGTLIISWLIANQIALAGLYLYILIALISITKRFFVK